MIVNRQNGHKYLGSDVRPLNKVWREILEKYESWNGSLYNTMKYYGVNSFTIRIVEEVQDNRLDERMVYWKERYSPEYNKEVLDFSYTKQRKPRSKLKWGYQRVHKPKAKKETNTIKCRSLETGKLKTLHGWDAAAKFCNGNVSNIKKAIRRSGSAYGYKWWIYKKAKDSKRCVYGVHKEGHITPVFESITAAMKAMGADDKGKGICTSIKWKQRWKGYMWYYSDTPSTS